MAKKKIECAEDFHTKILEFIRHCEENDLAPTDFRLWEFLGVTPSEYKHLSDGKDRAGKAWKHRTKTEEEEKGCLEMDKRAVDDALKRLIAYREDRLVQQLEQSKGANSNAIFQLKQAKNGGYQDIQQADNNATITIKVDGVGGLDAFK